MPSVIAQIGFAFENLCRTREQALTALTINVAKQMFIEGERGSISKGKYADLSCDRDSRSQTCSHLLRGAEGVRPAIRARCYEADEPGSTTQIPAGQLAAHTPFIFVPHIVGP